MPASPPNAAPAAWIVAPRNTPTCAIWGLSPEERLRRSLERAGCAEVHTLRGDETADPGGSGPGLVLRADWIYDERVITALATTQDAVLLSPAAPTAMGEPLAACVGSERVGEMLTWLRSREGGNPPGLRVLGAGELVPAYIAALRKYEPPYLYPARAELVPSIEERTFAASYKGSTDLVTKWLWPRPALAVTRVLAGWRTHPNTITVASWLFAGLAFWLFAKGHFGAGLLAAWLMTFLDTVDGKLARVTLTSSRIGHVLDHGLDLTHPPFWWFAWGVGLGWPYEPVTLVVVGGYFVGRALEGIFLLAFGMETHCWRPIDTLFRTITARRNPNLLLLSVGTLGGRPDLGFVMVALWTIASLLFHTLRLLQAFVKRWRGVRIEPWDESLEIHFRPIEESGAEQGSP